MNVIGFSMIALAKRGVGLAYTAELVAARDLNPQSARRWLITNAALMTYVIPASFLAIPFYRIMQHYGLTNNLWSVIAALVTFATPYSDLNLDETQLRLTASTDLRSRLAQRNYVDALAIDLYF